MKRIHLGWVAAAMLAMGCIPIAIREAGVVWALPLAVLAGLFMSRAFWLKGQRRK